MKKDKIIEANKKLVLIGRIEKELKALDAMQLTGSGPLDVSVQMANISVRGIDIKIPTQVIVEFIESRKITVAKMLATAEEELDEI